jgi:hypothetical protein
MGRLRIFSSQKRQERRFKNPGVSPRPRPCAKAIKNFLDAPIRQVARYAVTWVKKL